jgi:hypothetical protein
MTQALPPTPSAARRAGAISELIHQGMHWADAELWLGAWEPASNIDAERDSAAFWERGVRWAMDAWIAGQQPPTIEG